MPQSTLVAFPARTELVDSKSGVPTNSAAQWLTRARQLINGLLGPTGVGNGSVSPIQAHALGTGVGPLNPSIVDHWVQEIDPTTGLVGWRPIFR